MALSRRILIVDDDAPLRTSLAEELTSEGGFAIVEAETAGQGLETGTGGLFDLMILDVGLPDMDGRALCAKLRAAGVRCPIIMLTGADTDDDTVRGLDAGANDYVTKPFRFAVLLARIHAQLRVFEQSDDATFRIGPYLFRPGAKQLVDEGQGRKVRLTEKETAILKYLYRAGEKPVGRDELLHEVWGYNPAVTTHTLETHIYRLRQKIEPEPSNASLLVTEPGGYRLVT